MFSGNIGGSCICDIAKCDIKQSRRGRHAVSLHRTRCGHSFGSFQQLPPVELPEMRGFSRTNLLYMRAFAEAYPEESIVQQAVGQIPWGHNVRIVALVKNPSERLWYIQQTNAARMEPERACSSTVKAACIGARAK